MTNEFEPVRKLLDRMYAAVGGAGLVGAAWNGEVLKISVARPDSGKELFVMTFDSEEDYSIPADGLIEQYAKACERHFSV